MKLGRNDPCHCGSGKKYKHCCLGKEEETSRLVYQTRQELSVNLFANNPGQMLFDDWHFVPDEDLNEDRDDDDDWGDQSDDEGIYEDELDDETDAEEVDDTELNGEENRADWQAAEAEWDHFRKENLEGKTALFENLLEKPGPVEDLLALDMLEEIFEDALKQQARERYNELVEKFRSREPQAYREGAHALRENCIYNALVLGNDAALAPLVKEMIEAEADDFEEILSLLAYHGKLDLINEVMPLVCSRPEDPNSDFLWDPILASLATRYLAFAQLERNGAAPSADPAWYEPFTRFSKIPQEHLAGFMALLSGQEQRRWTPQDFHVNAHQRRPTAAQNIFELTLQFQGHLRREREIPFCKAELGRDQLHNYIFRRAAGEFAPRALSGNSLSAVMELRRTAHLEWPAHTRLLCPDAITFGHYIGILLRFNFSDYYLAAALMKLLPAWLDFLVAQQLLEPAHCSQTLLDLFEVYDGVHGALRGFERDPNLYQDLIGWPWRQSRPRQV